MVAFLFGKVRSYLRMFVESARHSGIDIAIVGFPAPDFPLPPNVCHVHVTWKQFMDRVSTRLFGGETQTNLLTSGKYKINDFKSLFAHLFPEEVQGYDWWGHVDNDLVLGDVRRFITKEMPTNYDVITPFVQENKMIKTWGPFTLYRNANVTNQLFLHASLPWTQLFGGRRLLVLDEWGRGSKVLGKSPYWNSSMSGILTNHHKRLGIRVWSSDLPTV